MPKQYIPKGTEIIVGDENWYLVDYDVVSVPEIIFMSFTEGKYNELRDDLEQDIANVDKINKWKIELSSVAYAAKGDTIHPVFSITNKASLYSVAILTAILPKSRVDICPLYSTTCVRFSTSNT